MHIGQEHRPFFSLQASVAKLSAKDNFALAGSAIDEGSGVDVYKRQMYYKSYILRFTCQARVSNCRLWCAEITERL